MQSVSTVLRFWFILLSLVQFIHCADPFGTCDNQFTIYKHTVASTDALRDCAMMKVIFPEIHDEGASKFHQGECAYQCKMEIPYTCFKLHAPQTRYDEGLLSINTIEEKISEKWKYALNDNYPGDYDPFFDFNMAFWVQSLDEYILHWQSDSDVDLEYFGIEWYLTDTINIKTDDPSYKNNKFYSILLHSPSSAEHFEFISYIKPSYELYNDIKWITDNIPRATFKLQSNPYPWNREDNAKIVPIKISHATTDVDKLYDFYHNILYAELLYYTKATNDETETIFMGLLNTHIELQFTSRPFDMTIGIFALKKYEELLMETHETIITSPYCGQDRWMDNHYAYSTWTIPGLMDAIYHNLNHYGIKYGAGKQVYEHTSIHTRAQLDLIGYTGQYTFGLWVIEPGGQSIQIGGIIASDPSVAYYASIGDAQWCQHACNWGLTPGIVDPSHIYKDPDDLRTNIQDNYNSNNGYYLMDSNHVNHEMMTNDINEQDMIYTMIGGLCIALLIGWIYCCCCHAGKTINDDLSFDDDVYT